MKTFYKWYFRPRDQDFGHTGNVQAVIGVWMDKDLGDDGEEGGDENSKDNQKKRW